MNQKPSTNIEKPKIETVSLNDLEVRLQGFEAKYGFGSEEFYQKAKAGLLDEQDAFITWLGYYEAYLRVREQGQ